MMISLCNAAVVIAVAVGIAACNDQAPRAFQGWIEANLIFVGPDEAGRVEALNVRERRCSPSMSISSAPM